MRGTTLAAVLVLLAWGAVKWPWESSLEVEEAGGLRRAELMVPVKGEMRDRLGQGLALAALGGFRGLAANFLWMDVQRAWEMREWPRLRSLVEMVTTLQPRVPFFWTHGAWHLAWNASFDYERHFTGRGEDARRFMAKKWVDLGEELLQRGRVSLPESPQLLLKLGLLNWQRREDYLTAAEYYREASRLPKAPAYAFRFAGYGFEKAGKDEEAYEFLRKHWEAYPVKQEAFYPRHWFYIERELRKLEKNLSIPPEKRIFTDGRNSG